MAANPTPQGIPNLLTMAEDCAEGVEELGETIGIEQNTAPKFETDITNLRTKQQLYREEIETLESLYTTQKNADKAGRKFLVAARRRLASFLGDDYNATWGAAGFPLNSTAVPDSIAARQQLLKDLSVYFAAHATQEDAALNITGAQANILYNALKDARFAVQQGETARDAAEKARNAAQRALEKRIRGLIGELEQLLAPDADEWATFNLNAPADPDTPEASEAPAVFPRGEGKIEVRIVLSRRADYNHIFVQRMGVDAEPRRIEGQFYPPNAIINIGAPDGSEDDYHIFVCGVNEAGSGPLSPPTSVRV